MSGKLPDKQSNEIFLEIPMLPNMELAVVPIVDCLSNFIRFEPDDVSAIKIALIEGVINASEHSKSNDKTVHIKFIMREDELEVTIQDFGVGFNSTLNTIPKPLQKRGYGLQLIKELMDQVNISSGPNGTKVTMIKRCTLK